MELNSRPVRTDGILVERTPLELLAFNDVTGEAHALNEVAAIVWDHCDGETTIAAMVPLVADATGLEVDSHVVELAIEELVSSGLIETGVVGVPSIGRRELIKKLGLTAAAAAIALPIVESIVTSGSRASGQEPPVPAPSSPPVPAPSSPPVPAPSSPPVPAPSSPPVPAPSSPPVPAPSSPPAPSPAPAPSPDPGPDVDDASDERGDDGPGAVRPTFTG